MTSDSSVRAAGSFYRVCRNGVAILIGFAACTIPVCAEEAPSPSHDSLKAIVVTGKRVPVIVPDAVLKERVEDAMRSDPYFLDEHVTVRVKNGVVILEGIVFDAWDLSMASRISRKIPGVKSVFNAIEIHDSGD